jgi:lipid-A-disaccharide synthase
MVLGVFPFEKAVYDKYGVGYKFVGHTMADHIALSPDKREAKQALGVPLDGLTLAILPGSRRREVATLLPIFLQTLQRLRQRIPHLRAIIPAATAQRQREIEQYLTEHSAPLLADSVVQVTTLPARTAMIACDAVLLASGTATLEAMLCKRPMVACYKLSRFTHWLMKYLYKPQYFSLPNLLADAPLVPELLQEQVNPELISQLLFDQLSSDAKIWEEKFLPLHHQLQKNADQSAANAVMELLHG